MTNITANKIESRESVTLVSHGLQLFGVFHRPLVNKKFPVILMCHGFAGTKVGRYRMYVRLSEALSAVGIGSLRLDFRGCGDSEGDFRNTTFEDQVDDALVGLQYLEQDPQVDTSRMGLLGRSLGGPVAVVAARHHGGIRSLALWAAVFHGDPWRSQWDEARRTRATGPLLFQGHPMNPELFMQLLSLNMVSELDALKSLPLFCVHSEGDEVVDMAHAEHFRTHRKRADAVSQFTRLYKSSHDFSDHSEQEQTIKETVAWYQQTLGD